MAIYHFSAKTGTLSGGQSARAKYDYIAREGSQHEHRDARLHIESGNMPKWAAADAAAYWSAADANERANGRLFKHLEIALPRELTFEQNLELARGFVSRITSDPAIGNLPHTLTMHAGGGGNPHIDVIISERVNDGIDRGPSVWFSRVATGKKKTAAEGGARKTDQLKPTEWLDGARKLWAGLANEALAKAGHSVRIDHRSLVAQREEALAKGDFARAAALDRAPGEHMGPKALGYEKRHDGKKKSNRRKHIEHRQRERRNLARDVVANERIFERLESQIREDQDALRRERGLRAKEAITRRIAAERAAGKTPAAPSPLVSPVTARGTAPAPKAKPAPLRIQKIGKLPPRLRSTIPPGIAKWARDAIKGLELLAKALERFREQLEASFWMHQQIQRIERARVAAAARAQVARPSAPKIVLAPAGPARPASQPQAKPAAQASPSPAPVVPDRPASADPRAAADAARRQGAERRIRLALESGKGRSAALVDAVRIGSVDSIERLVEAGADPTIDAHKAFKEAGSNREVVKALVQGMISNRTIQDHANLSSLAAQLPPEAAAQVREMAAAAKTGGSLSAAGFTEPSTPSSPQSPDISSGPSIDTGGGKGS